MAAPNKARKETKIGRNDPCHCGSGRKYKDCHLPQEEAARAAQRRLREAQETLLPRVIAAAQEFPSELPAALARFWNNRYSAEQMSQLDELEDRGAERFLVWFAFDYALEDGRTLVARLADQAQAGEIEVEPAEAQLLDAWRGVRLRAYRVIGRKKGQSLDLYDLLDRSEIHVVDIEASRRLELDEVVVAHLAPADTPPEAHAPNYYFVGAAAQLTPDTAEPLREYVALHLADLRRSDEHAEWADLLRVRSEVLNHFVTALPVEEHDPTIFEQILLEGRTTLQLTVEGAQRLLGRDGDDANDKRDGKGAD